MGTKYSGRYKGTQGASAPPKLFSLKSSPTLSPDKLKHSSEGSFNASGRPMSGGHGQENIEKLAGTKYEPKVTKTFPNGVRLGSIPNHSNPRNSKTNGHAWFPKNWTEKTIKAAGEYVARLKRAKGASDGETVWGTYKGVSVGIKMRGGKIETVFPNFEQPTKSNKKGKQK